MDFSQQYLGSYSQYFTSDRRQQGSASSNSYGCCPLVIDPLTLGSLLTFIGAAVYLLNQVITMSMLMMARKRKRRDLHQPGLDILNSGKIE